MSGTAKDRRLQRRKVIRAAAAAPVKSPYALLSGPVVITATAAAAGQPGRPPRIDIVAYNGGELVVDGFDLPVVIDYAGAIIPPTMPLNVDHNQSINFLLGQGTTTLNGNSLSISGAVTAQNPNAKEVVRAALQDQFPWQASVKAIIFATRRIAPGAQVQINGRTFTGPIIHATESQLTHCAVLGEGADQTSTVKIAAKAAQILKGSGIMSFEDWVKSLGLDPAALSPEAAAALQAQYTVVNPAVAAAAAPAVPAAPAAPAIPQVAAAAGATQSPSVLLAASRQAEAAEMRRVGEIRAKAREYPLIGAKGIEEGWSVEKVELEVLKAHRPTGPSHQAAVAPPAPLILEAALAVHRKIPGHEKQYTDQVLQAAHTQFKRGLGLQQLLLIAAAANGYQVGPGLRITQGNLKTVLRYAMPDEGPAVLQAAASGASIAGILSNIANKELLTGYMQTDQTWREIAKISTVTDFKTVSSYRMLDDMKYEQLAPDGKIAHGKLGEMSYTRQVDTYAKMGALTRKDIINDDLGALDDLRNRIGQGGGMKLVELFWTKFLALIGDLFTTGNGNYISGATTNLVNTDGTPNYPAIQLALNAFDAMRTPTADGSKVPGGKIGGAPALLLTGGGAISNAAEIIYKHTNLSTAAAPEDINNYAGKYKPVKSVFIDDSSIDGYTTTGWGLLRDPKVLACIVVSFLDGVETPTVEQADADFDQLGIQFRGYHDFGVDGAEPLAGVWSKGAA